MSRDSRGTSPNADRVVRSWLREDRHEDVTRVLDTVLAEVDTTPQRRSGGTAWRSLFMNNNMLRVGLGVAAVVVIAIIAINLLPGSPAPGGESSPSPSPSAAEPSTAAGFPKDVVLTQADDPVQVTVSIASSGWVTLPEFDAVGKDDDGLDSPESVGVALLAWGWPAGTGFDVYGDPCQWATTVPATPATTPDEIAAALAVQALTDASAPMDVSVGGYAGKATTLHVPMSYHQVPDVPREEEFADCDGSRFVIYGLGDSGVERNAQGPGQIDELWILDVNGSIVILDAVYGPAAAPDLVDELRTLAESATFE